MAAVRTRRVTVEAEIQLYLAKMYLAKIHVYLAIAYLAKIQLYLAIAASCEDTCVSCEDTRVSSAGERISCQRGVRTPRRVTALNPPSLPSLNMCEIKSATMWNKTVATDNSGARDLPGLLCNWHT